jgi:hypothetical protein
MGLREFDQYPPPRNLAPLEGPRPDDAPPASSPATP